MDVNLSMFCKQQIFVITRLIDSLQYSQMYRLNPINPYQFWIQKCHKYTSKSQYGTLFGKEVVFIKKILFSRR